MYREEIVLLQKENSPAPTAEPAPAEEQADLPAQESIAEPAPEPQSHPQNIPAPAQNKPAPKDDELRRAVRKLWSQPRQEESEQKSEEDKAKSLIVEKPNYDFIEQLTPEEEEKVYKIEKDKPKPKSSSFGKKLRAALFALIVSVCGVWGIVNIVEITNLESQIAATSTEYNLSLEKYLWYLSQLDQASAKNDLFDTYPSTLQAPSSIEKQSNWFDRLCNFIARLFGG